ncbi:MAG: leucine--tRNA ligase [Rickettsiales bacterium]|jgi:leucyl-tRNA synthetase|nr:leucine--tRNA ligase [Rickettsiales bacterium]
MSSNFPFLAKEEEFRDLWRESGCFNFDHNSSRPKYYILEMFPYPSGKIHMGHLRNYSLGDVIARYHLAKGYNVLHPMGFDSFGLPAENAAIEHGVHPGEWTDKNVKTMSSEFDKIGLSYDWRQQIVTSKPEYYKHEQKIFLELLKKDLAYQKETYVNWDPVDQTILANEQVVDGKGWRSGAEVTRKKIKSWFLRVSNYAENLLNDLDQLNNWPSSVIAMQKKWIGKSVGALIDFEISEQDNIISVFTTRPETIFGMSFIAISPWHPLAESLAGDNSDIADFIKECDKIGVAQEAIDKAEKLGLDTGLRVKHPFIEGHELPVYIANFVLMDYGTGAVFACPAHDQRDFDFAQKYKLPIEYVVRPNQAEEADKSSAYLGEGILYNSDFLNGLTAKDAKDLAIKKLELLNQGKAKISYKIRDWGVSRQRYWGCPIPIIYCDDCDIVPVPEVDLPIKLPDNVDFSQAGNPLENNSDWQNCKCPKCGKDAKRETDTFDTFFESSWYFARFTDAQNDNKAFDAELANKFLPVDQYIGGIEHAVLHLLYARFFTKALCDLGYLEVNEPFKNLMTQGMVTHLSFKNAKDEWVSVDQVSYDKDKEQYIDINSGNAILPQRIEKMSKSKKNGVNPEMIISSYGADTARLFMLSDSPPEKNLEWKDEGLEGAYRYINKLYKFFHDNAAQISNAKEVSYSELEGKDKQVFKATHKVIKQVSDDIESFGFNKAVAHLREFSNLLLNLNLSKVTTINVVKFASISFTKLLVPFTPYLAETIWQLLGKEGLVSKAPWPEYKEEYLIESEIVIAVQVNGKLRTTFAININAQKDEYESRALALPEIQNRVQDSVIKKVIIVPKRIVNVII